MLSVNVQHTERDALLYTPIQIYSGAEVSHTNRCRSVGTLRRHYNLVPKCPGAEVSWCRSVPRAQRGRNDQIHFVVIRECNPGTRGENPGNPPVFNPVNPGLCAGKNPGLTGLISGVSKR